MSLNINNSILDDIRVAVGLTSDNIDFDIELLMHINSSISKLNQNGIGKILVVTDEIDKWIDLQDETQLDGNKYFQMIPLFISLSTKILFDPPPPSNVSYHQNNIDQLLWRLKIAYEQPYVAPVVTQDE